jgi:hypothetical protein
MAWCRHKMCTSWVHSPNARRLWFRNSLHQPSAENPPYRTTNSGPCGMRHMQRTTCQQPLLLTRPAATSRSLLGGGEHRSSRHGRACPHLHQNRRRQKQHSPPPLAGGGWGEGWNHHRSRSRHTWQARLRGASPPPQPPPARGGGGVFSGVALILRHMGRVPAISTATGAAPDGKDVRTEQ